MMQVLFDQTKRNTVKPVYEDIGHFKHYLEEFLSYYITTTTEAVSYTHLRAHETG
jgi:subfamily B ATP-binding cassette protein MsbA